MNKGFTLLELVIAIVLIGIILPLILNPMLVLTVKGAGSDNIRVAGTIAEAKLEHLAGLTFDQVVSQATQNVAAPYSDYSEAVHVDYVQGPFSLDTNSATSTDYKRVRIAVSYKQFQPYVVSTLVTKL